MLTVFLNCIDNILDQLELICRKNEIIDITLAGLFISIRVFFEHMALCDLNIRTFDQCIECRLNV